MSMHNSRHCASPHSMTPQAYFVLIPLSVCSLDICFSRIMRSNECQLYILLYIEMLKCGQHGTALICGDFGVLSSSESAAVILQCIVFSQCTSSIYPDRYWFESRIFRPFCLFGIYVCVTPSVSGTISTRISVISLAQTLNLKPLPGS